MSIKRKIIQERYEQRVQQALVYIHENLGGPLDLNTVAKASSFSSYHFHRIFRAFMAETLNEYVRRRRLEKAVHMLVVAEDKAITDIALSCGFSSSSNFAKAFSNYFGCSPSEVRNPEKFKANRKIGELKRKYGKDFDPRKFYPEIIRHTQEEDMDVQVIDLPEKRVAILASPGGYNQERIYQTWDKALKWVEDNKLAGADYFGVCYDDDTVTPEEKCRYEAAVTVKQDTVIVAPFKEEALPAGKYAMAYYRGPSEPDSSFHMRIYRELSA